MPLGERIKENTKTASYTGVILLGVGLTGGLFYVIFRELFSSNSPQNIYSAALDRCVNDPQIQDALGAPIKGFGEENSRRRRRHVAHTIYQTEAGVKHIRMNFYIQGFRNRATVFLEKTAVSREREGKEIPLDDMPFISVFQFISRTKMATLIIIGIYSRNWITIPKRQSSWRTTDKRRCTPPYQPAAP